MRAFMFGRFALNRFALDRFALDRFAPGWIGGVLLVTSFPARAQNVVWKFPRYHANPSQALTDASLCPDGRHIAVLLQKPDQFRNKPGGRMGHRTVAIPDPFFWFMKIAWNRDHSDDDSLDPTMRKVVVWVSWAVGFVAHLVMMWLYWLDAIRFFVHPAVQGFVIYAVVVGIELWLFSVYGASALFLEEGTLYPRKK